MRPVQLLALGMSGRMGRGHSQQGQGSGGPPPHLQAGQAPQVGVARAGMGAS